MSEILSEVRLLAIAGPPVLSLETLVDSCVAAEAGGITAVQLRAKNVSAARLLGLTEELCDTLTIPVYLNDRADIALAGGAHGVHVGAEDLLPGAVRDLAGETLHIGVSVGTREEGERVVNERVDYWSIGSIYQTGTKPDAGRPIGPAGFRSLAALAPPGMTVIAIGGITEENVGEILDVGAHGVAVSRAVFGMPDVESAARMLRKTIEDRGLA